MYIVYSIQRPLISPSKTLASTSHLPFLSFVLVSWKYLALCSTFPSSTLYFGSDIAENQNGIANAERGKRVMLPFKISETAASALSVHTQNSFSITDIISIYRRQSLDTHQESRGVFMHDFKK